MAMGQAAGIAAAMTVAGDTDPREIDVTALQNTLKQLGALID